MKIQLIAGSLAAMFLLAISGVALAASHCEDGVGERSASTPDSRFEVREDGTVVDRETRLQWARCSVGQSFNGTGCNGRALAFTWPGAGRAVEQVNNERMIAGFSDWRLPTHNELTGIIERCREAPSINPRVFPDTPWAGFWTGTVEDEEERMAWFVGFYRGLDYPYVYESAYRIRPVREL